MKIAGMRLANSRIGMLIVGIYVYGATLEIAGLGWAWLESRNPPQYQWWEYLLAPFAIGAIAAVLEGLGTFFADGFTFDKTESKVRLAAGKVALVVLLLVLLIGIPMYHISQQ